ncbi:unnamed protein product [Phytophthora lilii]|uniref:Unnamed protein product n=1 Tax=Phytophthora lilii TaxID=2077276 RepID=A0A9W6YEF2_9STRA|nr:unnamed protein product [Phytophthora lilii]
MLKSSPSMLKPGVPGVGGSTAMPLVLESSSLSSSGWSRRIASVLSISESVEGADGRALVVGWGLAHLGAECDVSPSEIDLGEDEDQINPAKITDEIGLAKIIDEIDPAKIIDEIDPAKIIDEIDPAKITNQIDPAKITDEIGLAKITNQIDPAKITDEITDEIKLILAWS